jgi:membrane protein
MDLPVNPAPVSAEQPPPGDFFQRRLPIALRRLSALLGKIFKKLLALLVTSVKEFIKDDCLNLAAQISYYALFSVFPLILGIIIVFSFIYQDPVARYNLLQELSRAFPSGSVSITDIVNQSLEQSQQFRPLFFIAFFLGLIWGGSGIFDSLTNALNKAWQIPGQARSILESLLLRFVLFGLFILFIIGSLGVSVVFELARNFVYNNDQLRSYAGSDNLWNLWSYIIPWGLNFITFMVLFRMVPQRRVTFFDVWPGAVLVTALLELLKIGFNFYVTQVAHYSYTYGSLAGVVVFVFWLYLAALVILFGGEVSSVWAEMRGEKRPTKLARQGKLAQAEPKRPGTAVGSAPAQEQVKIQAEDHSLEYSYACEEVFCAYAPLPKESSQKEPEHTK